MTLDEYLDQPGRRVKVLAAQVGIAPAQLSQWRTGARRVPAERCPDIERITGRLVTCEEMRPDVDWAYLRQPCIQQESAA